MDGFSGFQTAASEGLPHVQAVAEPIDVAHLAGKVVDQYRRRIQQKIRARQGGAADPLYKARRVLHTRACLLTPRQQHQKLGLFASDEHVAL